MLDSVQFLRSTYDYLETWLYVVTTADSWTLLLILVSGNTYISPIINSGYTWLHKIRVHSSFFIISISHAEEKARQTGHVYPVRMLGGVPNCLLDSNWKRERLYRARYLKGSCHGKQDWKGVLQTANWMLCIVQMPSSLVPPCECIAI
jgi:hypothetical protein